MRRAGCSRGCSTHLPPCYLSLCPAGATPLRWCGFICASADEPCIYSDKLRSWPAMKYLHTMIRVSDPDATIRFFELLGLKEVHRMENEKGRFTLIYLAAPGDEDAQIELTHNWDEAGYDGGRNFGHIAYRVDDIYAVCQKLMDAGVTI